ncbi:MAG: sigma-70 family RNA polymerase sigma factor [Myxococcota bacterium]
MIGASNAGRTDVDAAVRARLEQAVRRFTPRWLRDQREDLVQTAVMRLLRGNPAWTLEDALLRRIAYSVVIDEIRRRKRWSEVGMSPSMPDRIASSGELSAESRIYGARVGEEVVAGLQTLVDDRRRAVTLYLQDHTVPEIAELLGWDRKRASNCVYRGLADLRDHLRRRRIGASLRG